jgi:glucose/arabinose dehydrogenase
MRLQYILLLTAVAASLAACGESATLQVADGTGPNPELPPPNKTALPTVNVAPARGWPAGAKPVAATGLTVARFAEGLDHPRWLYVLPDGAVLVAETNAPERPAKKGFMAWAEKQVMKKAGAGTPSANRITLLRDRDGDGVAEIRSAFLENSSTAPPAAPRLNSPFGMALIGGDFYVANADAVLRFPYVAGEDRITAPGVKLADLPGGPRNHHWTKSLIASADGKRLYVGVGSNSNVAEHGMDEEADRAAILEIDVATGARRVFASGLRNPVGMAWEPDSGALWVAVNERDELGSDLVPDYMTSVRDGGFYGWPYSYYGQHVDERVQPPRPDLVAQALVPDYALGPHTASLGLASSRGTSLPPQFRNGMFVGQHGSWNRKPHSGYKVIFVHFSAGKPAGLPFDVLTGFLSEDGEAYGRPVGVALDKHGALLVADDVGNIIWRVTASSGAP